VAQRAYLQQKSAEIHPHTKINNSNKKNESSHSEKKEGFGVGVNEVNNNTIPHFLTMTATPIPRTLALSLFGNLDLSILDEMPKNRKKIITKIINPDERNKIYEFIKSEIRKGHQCFVILPLVEESKILTEVKAATEEHKRLSRDIFPEFSLGLLHGKLKAQEKEKVMQDFKTNKAQILVATAVVEVGIDIPNATVMIIEDADRFGLSQLHQFRGRIGRSHMQSYCFLFSSSDTQNSKARLKAMEENSDGFKIAEKDLELRGPGQFLGTIQSGIPDIAMENLTNIRLIKVSQEEAKNILREDPTLKNHPVLVKALAKFNEKIHLE
jgi:ATP-dependent DNA helicase RecG